MWEVVAGEVAKVLAAGVLGSVKDVVSKRLARRHGAQDLELLIADEDRTAVAVRELMEADPEFAEHLRGVLALGTGARDTGVVPGAPAHFVDREAERSAAAGPGVRVISGRRGSGKSALVCRLAVDLRERYPDSQVYVDLADYRTDAVLRRSDVAARVLEQLGVAKGEQAAGTAELWAQYRSVTSRLRFLLALDNAESVTDVRELVPPSPSSLVLVTSIRQTDDLLAEYPESPIELSALAPGDAVELLESVAGVAVTGAERQAAFELAELCDRMPFALRLAGARVHKRLRRVPDAMASVVADFRRTGVLGGVDVIAEAFEQTFTELSPDAAELCVLLASHPGPDFTGAGASAVLGSEAGDALDELTDAGFLAPTGTGRQKLFNLVREGARRRGTSDVAVERALEFHRDQAVGADYAAGMDRLRCYEPLSGLNTDFEGRQPLDWVEDAREVYGALAREAHLRGRDVELGQICGALEILMLNRGHHRLFVEINRWGILSAERLGDPALLARILSQQGRTYFLLHEFARASPLLERALGLARELDNPGLLASVLEFSGRFHEEQRLLPAAIGFLAEAVRLDRAMADAGRRGLGIHTRMQANMLVKAGQAREAFPLLDESWANTADDRNRGRVLMVRARALSAVGHFDDAEAAVQQAWGLIAGSGATQYTTEFEELLGELAFGRRDLAAAYEHWRRAWQQYFDAGHPREAELRQRLNWR
ncbi:NB-ARC domain-containing protein [Amycolatopsis sp. H20-H5]|uniref:NB-ARC domain-containing protein n=1 Tax=Amycolatopsis sp. H20-H5 TaxID=3046309 RepID=UPI002DB966FD|nr:NB-ARC domain-containing protein [Amycolatopsis sp. H20-H5]MEC3977947.1 NB-ARC domain-containing protein [Amycolatopsis sp. H20-H5]